MKFNEQDVRKFYQFFKHSKPTEIRVFDKVKYPNGQSIFVKTEDEFVEKCKYYCEEGVSVYIGARDRNAKGDKNVISSAFVFFEIDKHKEGEDKDSEKTKILKFLEDNNIKVGMQGMSGGGWHFYIPHKLQEFKNSEEALSYKELSLNSFKKVFLDQKFDVDGAVFNLERVTRVMGTFNYKRNKISNIDYINEINLEENTKALYELLRNYKAVPKLNNVKSDIKYDVEEDNFIKNVKEKWVAPGREALSLSVAGYLRKEKKLGLNSTMAIVKKICEDCNDEEINSRLVAVKATFDKDEKEIKGVSGLIERDIKTENISVDDFLYIKYNKKGEEILKNVDIDKVADYIQSKFEVRTIYGLKEETIEIYEDGIWSVSGKGIIKAEVEYILKKYSKNNIVSEVLEKVKRRSEISREDADNIPDYKRCVENGVLDLEDADNIKFLPHSKEYNFKHKFPIKYIPGIKCPNNIKFIKEAFYEDDIPLIQEWFGFHLPRKYCFKKAVVIHGPKNTSKTVLVNLLTAFVGNNISGLPLQIISGGRAFDLLALKDKDANICDDLSSADMNNVGGFKMAVGDGWISGEQKFGDKIRFKNTAKNTNTCNNIPSPKDDIDDEAYYERILLLSMDNVINKEKQDKDLINKLTTQEELSGLLNWAIKGWKRLIKQNGFSNEKSPEETKFIMLQKGNSLAKFAVEVLVQENGAKVEKDMMYKVYCKWCMEHKPQLSPDTKEKIGRNLTRFAPFTQASSTGKKRYWSNVKITDTYYTFLQTYRVENEKNKVKDKAKNGSQNNIYNFQKSVISVSDTSPKETRELLE